MTEHQDKSELVREFLKLRQKVGELETFRNESRKVWEVLNKFKLLFSEISDLAYICDTRGNILYVNEVFEAMTGYKPDDFIGKPFAPLFDSHNLKKACQFYTMTLGGECPVYELVFKNTGVVCEYKNIPMRDECGKIVGVMGTARDITEKKRLEAGINRYRNRLEDVLREQTAELKNIAERLRESEAARKNALDALGELELRYRALSELVSGAVLTVDGATSRVEFTNNKAHSLLFSGTELTGKELADALPDGTLSLEELLGMARSSTKKELTLPPRGIGKSVLVELAAVETARDGKTSITVFLRDLSERENASAEIRKFHAAAELANSAILTTNKNGIVEYVNPAFERLTGFTRFEAAGSHFRDFTEGMSCDEFDSLWLSALEGRTWNGVFKNKRKGGGYSACKATVHPVKDVNGDITHFLFVQDEIGGNDSEFILDFSSLSI